MPIQTMSVQLLKRKFTIDQYHQMAENGIFAPSDRLELIQGEIIEMSPIGSRHAAWVDRLNQLFNRRLPESTIVRVQNPISLGDNQSEPQPDITILAPRSDFYLNAHPQPQDILLLVEVADTSADYDREVKIPLYAAAGITEVWLLDLGAEIWEVYRQPTAAGYQEMQQLPPGSSIAPLSFPEIMLTIF
ncbi:Uma2 family endonuclease [[Phormidium] sp. ETS-05]|uniref:Uma2 family endonuclease n=1 Tax=[Phormidium] sp. ETS-05 TaxID=222819 RepID=UPI001E44C789|nr:Uma2 family endonuclease [[Phormidium] sp. ETS-05]